MGDARTVGPGYDEKNFQLYLTAARPPLPYDSYGEPAPENPEDVTDEEFMIVTDLDLEDEEETLLDKVKGLFRK